MTDFLLTQAEIEQQILRDLRLRQPALAIWPESDAAIRAAASAGAIAGLYEGLEWVLQAAFPDTADPDWLVHHAGLYGITPLPPQSATGSAALTGNPGASVPAGAAIRRTDGQLYQVSALTTISAAGSASAPITSTPGVAGNASAASATFADIIPGIDAACIINAAGGADDEDPEHLRQRVLDYLRAPPAGGNVADYKRWAMSVPGVYSAWVFNCRRGPGTVDVLVAGQQTVPGPDVLAAVRAVINASRPAGLADFWVGVPSMRPVTVRVQIATDGPSLAAISPAVQAAITGCLAALQPGESLIKSRLESAISAVPGVVDRMLQEPAGNVIPAQGDSVEWLTPGQITIGLLQV